MRCRISIRLASRVLLAWPLLAALAWAADPTVDQLTDDDRELFGKFDINGDALLSKAEVGVWSWGRFDTSGDGNVSIVEFLSGRADDRRKAGFLPDDEQVWKLLDWTNDDFLSGTELDRGKWSGYDANQDGRVSKQEFLTARAASRPKADGPKLANTSAVNGTPAVNVSPQSNSSPHAAHDADWKTVEADGFRFIVPSEPQRRSGPMQTRHGTREVAQYQLDADDGATTFLVFSNETQATPAQLAAEEPLDEMRQIASQDDEFKLLDEKKITLGKYPGREFLLRGEGMMVRKRAYLVDGRLIQLVVATGDQSHTSPASIARFLNSLEVTAAPPQQGSNEGELEKQIADLLETGKFQHAVDRLTPLVAAQPQEPLPRFLRAVAWLQMGEYQKSIDDNNEVLKLNPNIPAAYNNRGWARFMLQQYDPAIADFDAALRLDASMNMSLKNRGWARFAKGQLDAAASDLAAALQQQPLFGWTHFNLALVQQARGDFSAALDQYAQALQLEPDYPSLCRMYAWMLATCPSADHRNGPRAIEIARHGCELTDYQDAGLLEALAAAAAETGDFEAAIKYQSRAIERAAPATADELKSRLTVYRAARPYRDRSQMAGQPWIVAAGSVDPRYPSDKHKIASREPGVTPAAGKPNPIDAAPAAAMTTFTNTREGLNAKLAASFVKFSFSYPNDWRMTRAGTQDDSGTYVDVEHLTTLDGKSAIVDSFSVGYLSVSGGPSFADELLPKLAVDLSQKLGQQFADYHEASQGRVTLAGSSGYEVRYTATIELPVKGKRKVFGRLILLPGPEADGGGVTLSMVATDAMSQIDDVSQVGVEGTLGEMLKSFKFAEGK